MGSDVERERDELCRDLEVVRKQLSGYKDQHRRDRDYIARLQEELGRTGAAFENMKAGYVRVEDEKHRLLKAIDEVFTPSQVDFACAYIKELKDDAVPRSRYNAVNVQLFEADRKLERVQEAARNEIERLQQDLARLMAAETAFGKEHGCPPAMMAIQAQLCQQQLETLQDRHDMSMQALESIAKNTCCDRCQEAAKVASHCLARLAAPSSARREG